MISSSNDYGIRKGFAIAFKKRALPAHTDLEKRSEGWPPQLERFDPIPVTGGHS